jgi:hypothetical protein
MSQLLNHAKRIYGKSDQVRHWKLDLRSDTFTRPTKEMLETIQTAHFGSFSLIRRRCLWRRLYSQGTGGYCCTNDWKGSWTVHGKWCHGKPSTIVSTRLPYARIYHIHQHQLFVILVRMFINGKLAELPFIMVHMLFL